jgi:RecA-family ATPase
MYTITNDIEAEIAYNKMMEVVEEENRVIELCTKMMQHYESGIDTSLERKQTYRNAFKEALRGYVENQNMKETKTQKKYKFASFEAKITKPTKKLVQTDETIKNVPVEFLKEQTKVSVDWVNYKKTLAIMGDNVVRTDTGEIVEGVAIENVEEKFEIK